MADQPIVQDEVAASLAAKINAMDLSDEERAMLEGVFRAAAEGAEVQGFGEIKIGQVSSTVGSQGGDGFPLGQLLGAVLGSLASQQAQQRQQGSDRKIH